MSNNSKQISELLNAASAAAPDVTKPLKVIGDGNMLMGIKNIANFMLKEGEKAGFLKGEKIGMAKGSAIAFVTCGVVYIIPKCADYIKKKKAMEAAHEEMGEKICTAFSNEPVDDTINPPIVGKTEGEESSIIEE